MRQTTSVLRQGRKVHFEPVSEGLEGLGRTEPRSPAHHRLEEGLAVVPKVAPTPPGFPRRTGVAKKRPLA